VTDEQGGSRTPAGGRRAAGAAIALGATAILLGLTGIVLHQLPGRVAAGDYGAWWVTNAAAAIAIALPGMLVAVRRPRNPAGWLLLLVALAHGITAAAREYSLHAVAPHSGLPAGQAALWVASWAWGDAPEFVALLFLFPNGRLLSRRAAPVFGVCMGVALISMLYLATYPGPMLESGSITVVNPLPWTAFGHWIDSGDQTILILMLAALVAGIGAMLVRARAVSGPARRSIVLVAICALLMVAEIGHEDFHNYTGEEYAGAAVAVLFAISIAFAILRYRLYEIDVVVRRTVVFGSLTVLLGAAYVAVVAISGAVLGGAALGAVPAAIVVALVFAPARARIQRASDRWLFGEREDPYAVMSSVGEQLDADDPADVLPTLAQTVAQTLKLPYVAIEIERDDGPRLAAERGTLRGEPLVLALVYGGAPVGRLVLGPRSPGERFTSGEQRLFADIARQAAVATHSVRLTEDLQRSREQLVTAREEERRRLRRDLHDGLGPTLAGISLQVASARMLATRDPAAADALLAQLGDECQTAIADVRRLVYALRPPALDELGLVPALRMQAARFPGLDVRVDAPDALERLPAAVEVAAYRIATEALTNVSRHAGARRCTITLSVNGHLELEVRDDGTGMPIGWQPGVGVASIRERATELGGSCVVGGALGGGTSVLARLPLPAAG
jgi:two-component system NarL family sensor kinase